MPLLALSIGVTDSVQANSLYGSHQQKLSVFCTNTDQSRLLALDILRFSRVSLRDSKYTKSSSTFTVEKIANCHFQAFTRLI
jgi:hypothetical protein